MAKVTLTVCDVCGDKNKATKRWVIREPEGSQTSLDLCDTDAAPLVKLITPDTDGEVKKPTRRGRIVVQPSPTDEAAAKS
jgi:hypothetical protein